MDLSQVTLTQLRYAVAVEEAGNFRIAASRCFVSQSGLSMQLAKLEDLLGVVLFDRSKKPVLLTDEGRSALPQMRTILEETERLGQIVAEEDEPAGHYRLGVIPSLSPSIVPLFLGRFVASYPRVTLSILELKTQDIITELNRGTLDGGIAATPLSVPGLFERALGVEKMFAYLPPEDSLLSKKVLRQADLLHRQLWVMPEGHCFRSQVLAYCASDNDSQEGPVHFESGSFETLIRLVDEGLGATVLPDLVVQRLAERGQKSRVRPLVAPIPAREIGLVTARSDLRRKVSDALSSLVEDALKQKLKPTTSRTHVLSPLD